MDLSLWPLNSIAQLHSFGRSPFLWQMGPSKKSRIRLPSFLKTDSTSPRDPSKHCSVSKVDPASRTARRASQTVEWALKKFALLLALLRARGAVVSRLQVMRKIWGYSAAVVSRTVGIISRSCVAKLEESPSSVRHIITVRKATYRI
jgi:DNA-binding response OmpR family regulator